MSKKKGGGASIAERIDAMEEAYEFMLAYAARGLVGEEEGDDAGVRPFLQQLAAALDDLGAAAAAAAGQLPAGPAEACIAFAAVLADDAAKSLAAVRLVLTLPSIGSQIIDNLNANIHLRAVLADLFLLDETLKA
jgi:hypothetical protein